MTREQWHNLYHAYRWMIQRMTVGEALKETVATDGRSLIRVSHPTESTLNFPKVPGFNPDGFKDTLIRRDMAAAIAKAIPRKSNIPACLHAAISTDPDGNISAAVTDLDTPQVFNAKPSTGQFPAWEKTIPTKDPTASIRLNPVLLMTMAKAVKDFGVTSVVLDLYDKESAVRFTAKNTATDQNFTGIVMPLRY